MKLNQLRTKTLSANTAAALDTAIAAFLAAAGEATFVDLRFMLDGGTYAAIILYAE